MLKNQPVHPVIASEKMLFEVSPFFPYLKRLDGHEKDGHEKAQTGTQR
jgi:hypothetical protein